MCCISILYTSNSTLLEINLAILSRVRIFTCSIKKLKVMQLETSTQHLHDTLFTLVDQEIIDISTFNDLLQLTLK